MFTRLAAVVLAGDMVGAIIVSGIANGELISLTLAPAELTVMLWAGPGTLAEAEPVQTDLRSTLAPLTHQPRRGSAAAAAPATLRAAAAG